VQENYSIKLQEIQQLQNTLNTNIMINQKDAENFKKEVEMLYLNINLMQERYSVITKFNQSANEIKSSVPDDASKEEIENKLNKIEVLLRDLNIQNIKIFSLENYLNPSNLSLSGESKKILDQTINLASSSITDLLSLQFELRTRYANLKLKNELNTNIVLQNDSKIIQDEPEADPIKKQLLEPLLFENNEAEFELPFEPAILNNAQEPPLPPGDKKDRENDDYQILLEDVTDFDGDDEKIKSSSFFDRHPGIKGGLIGFGVAVAAVCVGAAIIAGIVLTGGALAAIPVALLAGVSAVTGVGILTMGAAIGAKVGLIKKDNKIEKIVKASRQRSDQENVYIKIQGSTPSIQKSMHENMGLKQPLVISQPAQQPTVSVVKIPTNKLIDKPINIPKNDADINFSPPSPKK
jgi:hypothetical protein